MENEDRNRHATMANKKNLFLFDFFHPNFLYFKKMVYICIVVNLPQHFEKEAYCSTCNGKRRKFSNDASMASGSHAICVGCNFHIFVTGFLRPSVRVW